jgi:hypothetical protein
MELPSHVYGLFTTRINGEPYMTKRFWSEHQAIKAFKVEEERAKTWDWYNKWEVRAFKLDYKFTEIINNGT